MRNSFTLYYYCQQKLVDKIYDGINIKLNKHRKKYCYVEI